MTSPLADLRGVYGMATLSRLIVYTMCFLSVVVVGPYDTSASLPVAAANPLSPGLGLGLGLGLEALTRNWDSEYFSVIAREGYVYEHFHAFWPLVPWLNRFTLGLVQRLPGFGVNRSVLDGYMSEVAIPFVLGNAAFVMSAGELYRLSINVFERHGRRKSRRLARRTALVYCFCPASVFMSAMYTESIFALFSFKGLRYCYGSFLPGISFLSESRSLPKFKPHYLPAVFCFAMATLARSNGVLLGLNFGYVELVGILANVLEEGRPQRWISKRNVVMAAAKSARFLVCFFFCAIVPYGGFQLYGYYTFCIQHTTHETNSALSPPEWCAWRLPMLYAYVQEHYWNQGLWRYWQLKQLPNFLLALPMGLLNIDCFRLFIHGKEAVFKQSLEVLPFLLHFTAMTVVCVCAMHVQVLTRFVSACPVVYWYVAVCFEDSKNVRWKPYALLTYFMVYVLLGSSMFCCYYPWS